MTSEVRILLDCDKEPERIVPCRKFLPGLVVTEAMGLEKELKQGRVNITHVMSGKALIHHVPTRMCSRLKAKLAKADWTLSGEEALGNAKCKKVMEEVGVIMANMDDSKKQEKRIAADMGGKRQPGSGSRWGYKRDIVTREFMIEAKVTDKASFSVSLKDLDFIKQQAYMEGKVPAYVVDFPGTGVALMRKDDLDPRFIDEEPMTVKKKSAKTFTINKKILDALDDNKFIHLVFPSDSYLLMDYSVFLSIAKEES